MPHRGSRHGVPRWGGGDLERVALSVVGGSVEGTNQPGGLTICPLTPMKR